MLTPAIKIELEDPTFMFDLEATTISTFLDKGHVTSPNDYLSNFVPMSLAPGMGTISEELKAAISETLTVMTKIDFHSLSPDKNIEWNVAL